MTAEESPVCPHNNMEGEENLQRLKHAKRYVTMINVNINAAIS